ncbi:hypothetical protein BC832DRAFT_596368 [Gaertneriomyces semiglobifer]|nr:hypothetical protein BC832DRAFT_596368 [Gaertneriomyces semiglobifer]
MSGLNSRTAPGLQLLTNTNIFSGFVSGDGLQAIGEDVELKDFRKAHIEEISNKNGPMLINDIETSEPLSSTIKDGVASVSLKYNEEDFQVDNQSGIALHRSVAAEFPLTVEREDTYDVIDLKCGAPFGISEHGLSLVTDSSLTLDGEGKLTVVREEKETYEVPIVKDTDNVVKLSIDSPPVVKDGKLGVEQKEMSRGIGAISVYSAMDEIIPGMGDWIDIPDLPGDMEECIGNATLVKLNVSDDFQQTGSRLAIRSKGMHEVPYYSGLSGFNSSSAFTYNETPQVLEAPTFHAASVDFNITEPKQLPTAGYVHQLYQSEANGGIDISAVANGRKLIKVNHDDSLSIDETNRLGVNVSNLVDGTLVKAVNNKLTVDAYTPGDSISIIDNVISSKLTYGGSLRREGDQVIGKTVISGSSNVTVVQTNPFSYEVSVLNPQSQIDNLEDKVTDLNEKTDQNKLQTDNKLNDLETEDVRLDDRIDSVESRVSQQETKSDLFESDINTNRSNIIDLNNEKQQMQGDLINLAADLTGTTELLGTIQTAQSAIQVAYALMKGDVTSLQGIVTGIAGEVTGLSSTVAAIQAMPVVRGIIPGVGIITVTDPLTGFTSISSTTGPLTTKPTAPVNPTNKGTEGTLKDTYDGGDGEGGGGGGGTTGELTGGLPDLEDPILPPTNPIDPTVTMTHLVVIN